MTQGLVIEFGVLHGRSLRVLADKFNDRTVYGFDSFNGLNEDWGNVFCKGSMSVKGQLPKGMPDNVSLIVGLIHKTLPRFLLSNKSKISFLHIDTDTYTTAKCILDNVHDRLQVGSIILFDEYRGYPDYGEHEYRAFDEFKNSYPNLVFEELNIDDPYNWTICRSLTLCDMACALLLRPFEVLKAIYDRLCGGKKQTQAMFRVVSTKSGNEV